MGKYNENIADESIWLTSTPTQTSLTLPFYVTEAGHFYAEHDYEVNRDSHDSYLFMYTLKGCGLVTSGETSVELPLGSAIIIDCHNSHSYSSQGGKWEFLWAHIKGNEIKSFFDILYPNNIFAVNIRNPEKLITKTEELISKINEKGVLNDVQLSAVLHEIFNTLIEDSLRTEQEKSRIRYSEFVEYAVSEVHKRYSQIITTDDITADIPLSKYHFIRVFKRIMGTTPYNYLMNYRINNAKIFLRTTDLSVSEIAEKCGFSDTSNFIVQFKKHTDQKPLEYRRYFLS
ncbi:MAG: AraC family transcriptional regulator [Oscillospiraceae bacterium]|nr:AraC family transcriptional regulator [Oscillospiraceae bacterium]